VPLIISGIIIYYVRRLRPDQTFMAVALGLTLGGRAGQFDRSHPDRLRHRLFRHRVGALRNASNFADWSIVLGVILLAVATLLDERKQKAAEGIRGGAPFQSVKCDSLRNT